MEILVLTQHTGSTYRFEVSLTDQPVSYFPHGNSIVARMSFNIASGEVRNCNLISVLLLLKHKDFLLRKLLAAIVPASEIQPQLKRHVESIVLTNRSRLTATQVVN